MSSSAGQACPIMATDATISVMAAATGRRCGAAALAGVLANLLGYFPGARQGFGGREARGLMTDWSKTILSGRFAPKRKISPSQRLLTSLHIALEGDPFASLAAARRLAAIPGGETRALPATYPKGNPHLSRIKNPTSVIDAITGWLTERQPAQRTAECRQRTHCDTDQKL